MKPASRYLAGEWENERGWTQLEAPTIVDLERFSARPRKRAERVSLQELTVVRTPHAHGLQAALALHAARFPFDAARFEEFCHRQAALGVLDTTRYSLDGAAIGVSINLLYADERVAVAQLFAWDRVRFAHTSLGKLDFLLQAAHYKFLGFTRFCVGDDDPYKLALFQEYLCPLSS